MERNPVSIIVPTHNRSASLKRLLDALCGQSYPLRQLEVVVVADGCTDETLRMLRGYAPPFALTVIEQPARGPAAARNRGAEAARGELLLFIDDDVEPLPGWAEAHRRAHAGGAERVVIGPYPLAERTPMDFLAIAQRAWWDARFYCMRQLGHRFSFADMLGGNFSIERELFFRAGGFNPDFHCHEDYELGVRLIRAGAQFVFAPEALAYHHQQDSLRSLFARKYQEGRADVQLARAHPEISAALPLALADSAPTPFIRFLRALAFAAPDMGDNVARICARLLWPLERARLRESWRTLHDAVKLYWYWRGVASEIGWSAWRALLDRGEAGASGPEVDIDLSEGLERAEARLDLARPAAVAIRYAGAHVGFVFPEAGAEPLRGAHLRPILLSKFAGPLLEAMALAGALENDGGGSERGSLARAIRVRSSWFGRVESGKVWSEQYAQWLQLEGREPQRPALFWEQQARIRQLENQKAGLARQVNFWRGLAEERERLIRKQQLLIQELEREKSALDQERCHWEAIVQSDRDKAYKQSV
ncbi:MAG TPA: glycosyltransferase [Candidatus Acidoferrales bacterium]|nr:glycosyltransferase [Candidatus Acidoferrales bacterium]